jgi:hypothetical protein
MCWLAQTMPSPLPLTVALPRFYRVKCPAMEGLLKYFPTPHYLPLRFPASGFFAWGKRLARCLPGWSELAAMVIVLLILVFSPIIADTAITTVPDAPTISTDVIPQMLARGVTISDAADFARHLLSIAHHVRSVHRSGLSLKSLAAGTVPLFAASNQDARQLCKAAFRTTSYVKVTPVFLC